MTVPSTAMTYSLRTSAARASTCGSTSWRKTSCVMPSRSRRCMKSTPPRSRRRCTQPIRISGFAFIGCAQLAAAMGAAKVAKKVERYGSFHIKSAVQD